MTLVDSVIAIVVSLGLAVTSWNVRQLNDAVKRLEARMRAPESEHLSQAMDRLLGRPVS